MRDRLLGRPVSDIDWWWSAPAPKPCRPGLSPGGRGLPVFLHPDSGEEYALARTERKSGQGYGGFTFHASPDVTLEEDLIRRPDHQCHGRGRPGPYHRPYGGQRDLAARLLRHVSRPSPRGPLRVLRVARFAARYAPLGFSVAPETWR